MRLVQNNRKNPRQLLLDPSSIHLYFRFPAPYDLLKLQHLSWLVQRSFTGKLSEKSSQFIAFLAISVSPSNLYILDSLNPSPMSSFSTFDLYISEPTC